MSILDIFKAPGPRLCPKVETSLYCTSTIFCSVEYKPVVSLEVDRLHIYEGDSVKLSCAAAAVPELVEYSWRLGEEEIKEGRGAKEVVIVVDRSVAKIIVS